MSAQLVLINGLLLGNGGARGGAESSGKAQSDGRLTVRPGHNVVHELGAVIPHIDEIQNGYAKRRTVYCEQRGQIAGC